MDSDQMTPRYVARFTPQAWIKDYAVEVDAEGPREWDCTAFITGTPDSYFRDLLANTDGWDVLDDEDRLQHDEAAPEWVREWRGPFDIHFRAVDGND